MLDQPAQLTIWRADQPVRYVHGVVSDFEQGDTGFRRTRYRAVVEPKLARTGLCADWRIFQRQSVPDILSAVLKEHGITDYEQLVTETHLPREYCVQAGDSDLHFLARLAAEEGFYYAFAFADASHRPVHGDNLYIFGAIDGGPVEYNATPGGDQPRRRCAAFATASACAPRGRPSATTPSSTRPTTSSINTTARSSTTGAGLRGLPIPRPLQGRRGWAALHPHPPARAARRRAYRRSGRR